MTSFEGYCPKRCVVWTGDFENGVVCVCELKEGHEGKCERIPTPWLANVHDWNTLTNYKHYLS